MLIILGLFIADRVVQEKNKDYCLSHKLGGDCPEGKCYYGHCPKFTESKSACCPSGLFIQILIFFHH